MEMSFIDLLFLLFFLINVFQKIAELNEILEVRESKLLEMSMKNAELSEANSNLKR